MDLKVVNPGLKILCKFQQLDVDFLDIEKYVQKRINSNKLGLLAEEIFNSINGSSKEPKLFLERVPKKNRF